MADEKVLSYQDIVVTKSDLDLLKGPCYLNDVIITFYFRYISSSYQSKDILLVAPTISFWLANCQEPKSVEDCAQSLNFPDKQLIIFPVNDNNDVSETDGGTHWSLLVYFRKSNSFVHHDSMGGINSEDAMKLYNAVKGFVGSGKEKKNLMTDIFRTSNSFVHDDSMSGIDIDDAMKLYDAVKRFGGSGKKKKKKKKNLITDIFAVADSNPSFEEGSTPHQTNLYDCGLYVMAITRVICQWYLGLSRYDDDDLWFSAVEDHVDVSVELTMRIELLNLIQALR